MKNALQRWLAACPLMALALAGVAGIVLAEHDVAGMHGWILPVAMVAMLAALVRPRRWLVFAVALLGFASLHMLGLDRTLRHLLRMHLIENGGGVDAVVE